MTRERAVAEGIIFRKFANNNDPYLYDDDELFDRVKKNGKEKVENFLQEFRMALVRLCYVRHAIGISLDQLFVPILSSPGDQYHLFSRRHGHFTIADNFSVSDDELRKIISTYDRDTVWYRRDIRGERAAAYTQMLSLNRYRRSLFPSLLCSV